MDRPVGDDEDGAQYLSGASSTYITFTLKVWEGVKKHRKNCECCPVSQLIVRYQKIVMNSGSQLSEL